LDYALYIVRVSLIAGATDPRDVDPRLICPIFHTCACYLPKKLRDKLHCGIDFENAWEVKEKEPEKNVIKPGHLNSISQ
jgi:hypothetical protein